MLLFRSLAGALMGLAIGAGLARDWPSAAGWLQSLGMLSAVVFLALAQSVQETSLKTHLKFGAEDSTRARNPID